MCVGCEWEYWVNKTNLVCESDYSGNKMGVAIPMWVNETEMIASGLCPDSLGSLKCKL